MPTQHPTFVWGEQVVIRPSWLLEKYHARFNHVGANRGIENNQYAFAGSMATVCDISHEMCSWVTYQLGFFGPCVDVSQHGVLPGYWFEQCIQDFVYNDQSEKPVYLLDFQAASDVYLAQSILRDGKCYCVIRRKDCGTEMSATLCPTAHQSEFLARSINLVARDRSVLGFHNRYQLNIHPTEIDT